MILVDKFLLGGCGVFLSGVRNVWMGRSWTSIIFKQNQTSKLLYQHYKVKDIVFYSKRDVEFWNSIEFDFLRMVITHLRFSKTKVPNHVYSTQ